jgi:hypothetical protein
MGFWLSTTNLTETEAPVGPTSGVRKGESP